MKNIMIALISFISIISFVGCAQKQMYYFGDYSKTLYCVSKDNNAEARTNHQQQLEEIISESKTNNLPVPPGIYAELGYINLRYGKSKEAIKLFQMETALYPESKPFMDRLINKAEVKQQPVVNDTSESISSKTSAAEKQGGAKN